MKQNRSEDKLVAWFLGTRLEPSRTLQVHSVDPPAFHKGLVCWLPLPRLVSWICPPTKPEYKSAQDE